MDQVELRYAKQVAPLLLINLMTCWDGSCFDMSTPLTRQVSLFSSNLIHVTMLRRAWVPYWVSDVVSSSNTLIENARARSQWRRYGIVEQMSRGSETSHVRFHVSNSHIELRRTWCRSAWSSCRRWPKLICRPMLASGGISGFCWHQ
jgi:hypothetical protein